MLTGKAGRVGTLSEPRVPLGSGCCSSRNSWPELTLRRVPRAGQVHINLMGPGRQQGKAVLLFLAFYVLCGPKAVGLWQHEGRSLAWPLTVQVGS